MRREVSVSQSHVGHKNEWCAQMNIMPQWFTHVNVWCTYKWIMCTHEWMMSQIWMDDVYIWMNDVHIWMNRRMNDVNDEVINVHIRMNNDWIMPHIWLNDAHVWMNDVHKWWCARMKEWCHAYEWIMHKNKCIMRMYEWMMSQMWMVVGSRHGRTVRGGWWEVEKCRFGRSEGGREAQGFLQYPETDKSHGI